MSWWTWSLSSCHWHQTKAVASRLSPMSTPIQVGSFGSKIGSPLQASQSAGLDPGVLEVGPLVQVQPAEDELGEPLALEPEVVELDPRGRVGLHPLLLVVDVGVGIGREPLAEEPAPSASPSMPCVLQRLGLLVDVPADRLAVEAGRGDRDDQRILAGQLAGGQRVVELRVLVGVELVDHHERGVQAVLQWCVGGEHPEDAVGRRAEDRRPLRLQVLPQLRRSLDELAGLVEDDPGLILRRSRGIDLGTGLVRRRRGRRERSPRRGSTCRSCGGRRSAPRGRRCRRSRRPGRARRGSPAATARRSAARRPSGPSSAGCSVSMKPATRSPMPGVVGRRLRLSLLRLRWRRGRAHLTALRSGLPIFSVISSARLRRWSSARPRRVRATGVSAYCSANRR